MEENIREVEKITRTVLRNMCNGDSVRAQCQNGLSLESQKNVAYAMQKIENCRFRCRTEGLVLTVRREAL